MTGELPNIEQIVAEVVKRITELTVTSTPAATDAKPQMAEPVTAAAHELVLDARVITTATTHGRLQGIRSVLVDQRAVVTPSVKDELRKRGIRLEYREAHVGNSAAANLRVVRYLRLPEATRAAATLPLPSGAAERVHGELAPAVQCCAGSVVDSGHVAVLLTDESLAALCLLNRSSHVRAAAVRMADDVRQAISAIGANVLIVDPRDVTANQWNVMIQEFRSNLPRACPPTLQCGSA